jgi:signal transduction histidine kinase
MKDNGTGFDESEETEGNGLRNMKNRIIQLNGKFEISNHEGVRLRFMFPIG